MSGPQIWLCLFTFRPIASKKVKWLDCNRYFQLTRWCSGYASALGARGPGFNPQLRQGFLCLIFCFVVVVFTFLSKNTHYLSQKFAIPFTILSYLVYLRYCKIYDRLKGYKDTDLASSNLLFRFIKQICLSPSNCILHFKENA